MEQYKQEFIEFMISCGVLKFGDFATRSGRKMPSFVNTGFCCTGMQLRQLGVYYVRAIRAALGKEATSLFGPAYKDIPLCVAASINMGELYEQEVSYVADRKEVKDHGNKEILLSASIRDSDKIVTVEDVTAAGTSTEETMPVIKARGNAEILGLVVSVNCCEGDKGKKSALSEVSKRYGIKTTAIVTMKEVIEHLYRREMNGRVTIDDALMERIDAYCRGYGAEEN